MTSLFTPLQLGALQLPNRITMAPLTRSRAGDERLPNALMAEYYAQRADAGLIFSEATSVMPQGVGYAATPGIWNREQTAGWAQVTKAVHDRGGRIVLQLWHVGRVSDPIFLNGELPVAPSSVPPSGHVSLVRPERPYVTPRALETDEIAAIVEAHRKAAQNAKHAGFDGVTVHAANGYLIEQFLRDGVNRRDDRYGGDIANRARLLTEVVDAVIEVWGADRVGLHLSPRGSEPDLVDSDPQALYTHIAREMGKRGLAFLFLREHVAPDSLVDAIRDAFGGPVILNEGLTPATAEALVSEGRVDAVAFGRDFIATPDLVARIREDAALNPLDPTTLYVGGAKGYTDYPVLADVTAK